jgi:hypothetical protein
MFEDLTGRTFFRLKVAKYLGTRGKNSYWDCVCSCGKTTAVRRDQLVSGVSRSCGCHSQESNAALHEKAALRRMEQIARRNAAQKMLRFYQQIETKLATERKTERENKREAKRAARRNRTLRRIYLQPINDQIAAVIRHLHGQLKTRHVANFFGVEPALVREIWAGHRWLPLPSSSVSLPYLISSADFQEQP